MSKVSIAEVERIALDATAHNYGVAYREISNATGIMRVRLSSWPRANEVMKALNVAGYTTAQDGNEVMVLAGPALPEEGNTNG